MAYVYLLDLHKFIDHRLTQALKSLEDSENEKDAASFHTGRIEILSEFKNYLTINLNPKLPRRIRESYKPDRGERGETLL